MPYPNVFWETLFVQDWNIIVWGRSFIANHINSWWHNTDNLDLIEVYSGRMLIFAMCDIELQICFHYHCHCHFHFKVIPLNAIHIIIIVADSHQAKEAGYCNWGFLDDSLLPLGFGIAFHQGSQFKRHFDAAYVYWIVDILVHLEIPTFLLPNNNGLLRAWPSYNPRQYRCTLWKRVKYDPMSHCAILFLVAIGFHEPGPSAYADFLIIKP